jgi:hypothetical protein
MARISTAALPQPAMLMCSSPARLSSTPSASSILPASFGTTAGVSFAAASGGGKSAAGSIVRVNRTRPHFTTKLFPVEVIDTAPIKRERRTKAEISKIKDGIVSILKESHPQTVRHVFYALTVRGLVGKLEKEYHQTVIRLLTEMRESEAIPFEWIADNTRWMRKPTRLHRPRSLPRQYGDLLPAESVGIEPGLCRGVVREGRSRGNLIRSSCCISCRVP